MSMLGISFGRHRRGGPALSPAQLLRALTVPLLLLTLAAVAKAEPPGRAEDPAVPLSAMEHGQLSLSEHLHYLENNSDGHVIETLLAEPHVWQPVEGGVPNFGFTRSGYWFRVALHNDQQRETTHLLEVANPILDYVDLYLVQDGRVVKTLHTGDQRLYAERPIDHRNLLLPIDLPADSRVELYIYTQTDGALQLPVTLWDTKRFFEYDQYAFAWQLTFAGIMLALAAYNLLLLFAVRDIGYLWYGLNALALLFFQLSLRGVTYQFLWPGLPELNNIVLVASSTLGVGFASLFAYTLLDLHKYGRVLRTSVLSIAAAGFITCGLSFFMSYAVAVRLMVLVVIFAAPGLLFVGAYLWFKGNVLARLYTIAWITLHSGHAILAFSKLGLLPRTVVVEYAPQIGSTLEVLLLSFALAYRINLQRRQLFLAQATALQAEREARSANERALSIQQDANEQLEYRVSERTLELESANRQLREVSLIDGLTQVRNRRFFEEALEQEWRRSSRDHIELPLLMLDVDHFKDVNDVHGHLAGDACLQHLAQIYAGCLHRPADFVARYGGEEFAILLAHTNLEGAAVVAEKIRRKVESTPALWDGQSIALTVSIGVAAVAPKPGDDHKILIRLADEALYAAKRNGRNTVVVSQQFPDGETVQKVYALQPGVG